MDFYLKVVSKCIFELLFCVRLEKRFFHYSWVDQRTSFRVEDDAYRPASMSELRFALSFAVTMWRSTLNLFQVFYVVSDHLVHLFGNRWVGHASVCCLEVDEPMAHLSVLGPSTCLNLQIYAKRKILPFYPFNKANFRLYRLPRLTSVSHRYSGQVRNWGRSSVILARGDNIVDYDPTMIASCEYSVHILVANTRHMLESRFRFSVRQTSIKLHS